MYGENFCYISLYGKSLIIYNRAKSWSEKSSRWALDEIKILCFVICHVARLTYNMILQKFSLNFFKFNFFEKYFEIYKIFSIKMAIAR